MDACSGRKRCLNLVDNDLGSVSRPWRQLCLVKYYLGNIWNYHGLWQHGLIVHYVFEFSNGFVPKILKGAP